jgi:hypothetical protein
MTDGQNGSAENGSANQPVSARHGAEHLTSHRWKPGQSGNPAGRPRGIDFRALVKERIGAEAEADIFASIFAALAQKARAGDVKAARLLFDRLCDDAPAVEIGMRHVHVPTDEEVDAYLQRLRSGSASSSDASNN